MSDPNDEGSADARNDAKSFRRWAKFQAAEARAASYENP